MIWQKGSFIITNEKEKMDVEYIHHFLSTDSYWAENIPIEIVKKSIEGSVCFGIFESDKQIGFARVVTDNATFGYLADVFIDEMYRGCGLSKWLMETIMAHPELQGFRTWMLGTKDAHGLYTQFGFTQLDEPDRIMRKTNAHAYPKKAG